MSAEYSGGRPIGPDQQRVATTAKELLTRKTDNILKSVESGFSTVFNKLYERTPDKDIGNFTTSLTPGDQAIFREEEGIIIPESLSFFFTPEGVVDPYHFAIGFADGNSDTSGHVAAITLTAPGVSRLDDSPRCPLLPKSLQRYLCETPSITLRTPYDAEGASVSFIRKGRKNKHGIPRSYEKSYPVVYAFTDNESVADNSSGKFELDIGRLARNNVPDDALPYLNKWPRGQGPEGFISEKTYLELLDGWVPHLTVDTEGWRSQQERSADYNAAGLGIYRSS